MTTIIKCISELDIGPEASAAITEEHFKELLDEVLRSGLYVLLLKREIAFQGDNSPPSERIDIEHGGHRDLSARLFRQARNGFRMAVVLSDAKTVLRVLESRGYERTMLTSPGSQAIIQNWIAWLEQFLFEGIGVLVFGHDYEPAFVFERIEVR